MATSEVRRKKDHKGGKALSLSIILSGVGVVGCLALLQVLALMTGEYTHPAKDGYDKAVVTVINNTESNALQPNAAKIEAMPQAMEEPKTTASEYAEVWDRLYALADVYAGANNEGVITDDARGQFINDLLNGLNYRADKWYGTIVSQQTGDPISSATLLCYLNGYVHDKPHLKANCPTY